jgi:hypothetical protein
MTDLGNPWFSVSMLSAIIRHFGTELLLKMKYLFYREESHLHIGGDVQKGRKFNVCS